MTRKKPAKVSALYRIGRFAFRHSWWVISFWVVLLAGTLVLASQIHGQTSSSLSIPGIESQEALDRYNELFPSSGSKSAKVVIETTDGSQITSHTEEIANLTRQLAATEGVVRAVSPFESPQKAVSDDGTIAFVTVQLQDSDGMVTADTIERVRAVMDESASDGLVIAAGGDLVRNAPGEILGIGEVAGLVIALLVLIATFASLVAAGMPILTALVSVGVSMGALFSLSSIMEFNNTTPVLAIMLGLAVGIDYSLFIVNRFRTLLHEGYATEVAAAKAIATAGNAVLFAAATVVIALAALTVVQIPFMTTMGLAAAGSVALAAIVAVTFVPAMLGVARIRVFGRKGRAEVKKAQASGKIHDEHVQRNTIWYKLANALLRFRKTILIGALALVVVIALPFPQLTLGLPTDETAAPGSSEWAAYDALTKGFGAGYSAPLLLLVEGMPEPTDTDRAAVQAELISRSLQAQATAPATPAQQQAAQAALQAQVAQYVQYYQLHQIADRVADIDTVDSAQAVLVTDGGTRGVIQVTPSTGPSDPATQSLVETLRETGTQQTVLNGDGVTMRVTGTTAIQIDINAKLAAALPIYLTVVIGLSLILLMVAFRSILIPLKATLGFLLSVAAMFGALVAVFQWGWFGIAEAPGPIVSFIPIIALGILFGLAMDYEFFLVSSIQEAHHRTSDTRQSIIRGYSLGSRVVVAAGLIMVSVFAGFITNHDSTIQSIGFALTVGILVDAFIVRLIIVPIVMSYLGKAAWWLPKWLDKRLPHVSIEGE